MFKRLLSFYSPKYPTSIVYMLQSTEYQIKPYLKWYWRTADFNKVMYRRSLHKTKAAMLLLILLTLGICMQIVLGIVLILLWNNRGLTGGWQFGLALLISYPVVWAYLIVVPLLLGKIFIIWPRDRKYIRQSKKIFSEHKAVRIAVAGSYGKTSMKELLLTVLREGKHVVATPANKNVASSHAKFARKLKGDEEVIIIEYGEGKPGDVAKFAKTTAPTMGVITGVAPAHLDHYPNLAAAAKDIFSLADYLDGKNVYVNGESPAAKDYIQKSYEVYDSTGVLGWKVSKVKVTIEGTSFEMKKGKTTLKLKSGLLGEHNVGPLALTAALADKLGLTKAQIEAGVANTQPFEHRMQARAVSSAWIIDDTYNGNIDGIRAGLALLKKLPATRKIYISPGLVDQGVETKNVHIEMGELIAAAKPDSVVLMYNSAAPFIKEGLEKGQYKGGLVVEEDPLNFYSNIDQFVAAGDIVLMQNDWTDNYN
jgi:UDP-N-acetylmuramoyl-tripeptide--D-alanyl-D-alanine ligase